MQMDPGRQTPGDPQTGGRGPELREWLVAGMTGIILAVTAGTALRAFVLGAVVVPSRSMCNTVVPGDRVMVSKLVVPRTVAVPLPFTGALCSFTLPPLRSIRIGDVLVARPPADVAARTGDRTAYILKRCAGLPGDTLVFHRASLFVNGLHFRLPLHAAQAVAPRVYLGEGECRHACCSRRCLLSPRRQSGGECGQSRMGSGACIVHRRCRGDGLLVGRTGRPHRAWRECPLGQDREGDTMNGAGRAMDGSGPVGLYVHVPFCERKCAYCDFYSLENRDGVAEYLDAVESEIRLYAEPERPLRARTLYYGGGTPSILTIDQLRRMQDAFARSFALEHDAEITIEVNPGTVTQKSLAAYRSLGFNRLSIGVQSFDPAALAFLGRIHSADDARRCLGDARDAGFDNVSIDLIYSVPGQSDESWYATLDEAVALAPEHISAYSLIVEEQTPLFVQVSEGWVTPNTDAHEASLYEGTMERLERAGFEHYEVSNYARSGRRSRHNGSYWDHTPYLGFGPSAHSFLGGVHGETPRRWSNVRSVGGWNSMLRKGERPLEREEILTAQELFEEGIFLGLRSDGLDPARVEARSGLVFTGRQQATLQGLLDAGLARRENGLVRLTTAGYVLCDEICARMLVP